MLPTLLAIGIAVQSQAPEPIEINAALTARPLEPGVWVIVHEEPWPANALLVETNDGTLVLCDTPYTHDASRELLAWMHETFGDRRTIVINGHFHPDCLGGNAVFERSGAETWGSIETAKLLAERGDRARADTVAPLRDAKPDLAHRIESDTWAPPVRRFELETGHTFDLGEPVEIIHPGPAHAPDNVVTWFPERGVLFGGCAVLADMRPGYAADADLERWPDAIRAMQALEARIVIPGHGDRTDAGLLDHTLAVLAR